jgi:hypothetical protein
MKLHKKDLEKYSLFTISLNSINSILKQNLEVAIYEITDMADDPHVHPCVVKVRSYPDSSHKTIELFSESFALDDEQFEKVKHTLTRLVYLASEFPEFSATIIQNEAKKFDISLQNTTIGYRLEIQSQGNFFYIPVKSKIIIDTPYDKGIVSK